MRSAEEIRADEVMECLNAVRHIQAHGLISILGLDAIENHLYEMHKLRDQNLYVELVHWDYKNVVCCWSHEDRKRLEEMQCG